MMQESRLKKLEAEGIVPCQDLVNWRPAAGEEFPSYQFDHEIVAFESFFRCWFNVPPSKFLLNVLDWYQIELHNLKSKLNQNA